eukprot:COSAG06_NODE_19271_length_845_cov_3.387399_1_plen_142_part_00
MQGGDDQEGAGGAVVPYQNRDELLVAGEPFEFEGETYARLLQQSGTEIGCTLHVKTCGWHSATGEQLASRQAHKRTYRQQWSSGAVGSPAERHITLATPAVSRADRGTESDQPPCAGRDGRGGSCDAPVASHSEAGRERRA